MKQTRWADHQSFCVGPKYHNVPNSTMWPNSTHCHILLSSATLCQLAKILCDIASQYLVLWGTILYCVVLSSFVGYCLGPTRQWQANPRKGIAHRKQDIEQRGAKGSISVIPHWSLVDRPTQLICIWIFIRQQANTKDIAGQSGPVAYHPPKIFLLH